MIKVLSKKEAMSLSKDGFIKSVESKVNNIINYLNKSINVEASNGHYKLQMTYTFPETESHLIKDIISKVKQSFKEDNYDISIEPQQRAIYDRNDAVTYEDIPRSYVIKLNWGN